MVKPNSAGKENDNSTRFCVDFRKVNEITKKDAYPIPRIDDTFNTLSGAKYFSSVDMFSGHWQVELKEEDKEKNFSKVHTKPCRVVIFFTSTIGLDHGLLDGRIMILSNILSTNSFTSPYIHTRVIRS
jgi:hypothetical protein